MNNLRRAALAFAVIVVSLSGSEVAGANKATERLSVVGDTPLTPAAIGAPSTLVPVAPARIADTRIGMGGVQGPLAHDATIDFQIIGQGGVPAEATSVVLNVTAADPEATGYFTVFATGATRPDASNLNVVAGKNVANLVIARIGTSGKVSLYNYGGNAHVIFDVTGYFVNATGTGRFHGVTPQRLLDTRVTREGVIVTGIPAPGTTIAAPVSTLPPEAFHATAVLVNVTATAPRADGYLSVFPTGQPLPPSSNLNFKAGQTVANAVIVKVGQLTNGWTSINVNNALASTHVIVDLMGIFDDGTNPQNFSSPTAFRALDQPVRVFDTRTTNAPLAAHETRLVNVGGAGGAPPGALGAVFNATATNTTAASYLSVWPPSAPQPNVSSLNWGVNETVPNFVGVFIAAGGVTANQLAFYNDAGEADLLLDVSGYFYPV